MEVAFDVIARIAKLMAACLSVQSLFLMNKYLQPLKTPSFRSELPVGDLETEPTSLKMRCIFMILKIEIFNFRN